MIQIKFGNCRLIIIISKSSRFSNEKHLEIRNYDIIFVNFFFFVFDTCILKSCLRLSVTTELITSMSFFTFIIWRNVIVIGRKLSFMSQLPCLEENKNWKKKKRSKVDVPLKRIGNSCFQKQCENLLRFIG